jgi:hypothetical protein
MQPSYNKGDFQSYRAITKIHLGSLSDNLHEGEEVEYDGFVMRRGGDDHALHTLRAAIKVGWLVPVGAPPTQYVPQPAGIKVHKADGLSNDEVLNLDTVFDEDVNVGTIAEIRPAGAPPTHRADRASETRPNPHEGVVVGRFKTSAKQAPVEIGRDDRKVVQELDNKTKVEVEKVAIATGDVQEAIGGDSLAELLPNAESSGVPTAGVAGEGRGDEADRRAQQIASRVSPSPSNDALTRIRQFIPAFEWDLNKTQWAKRAKIAVEKYGDIPPVLDYILSVETDTVKRHIEKRLADSQR